MDIKRILTSVIGLPLVSLILIFGNTYIMDIVLMIITIICMKEYFNVTEKVAHPIKWVGYLSTIIVLLVSIISVQDLQIIIMFGIPVLILILFLHVIITNMKFTFKDAAYTFLGIFYVSFCTMFLSLIRGVEHGKIMLGFTIVIAWATDIAAYLIGKNFGKHHFSKVSPKKSVEGCIAGIIGAVVCGVIYIYISNRFWGLNTQIPYLAVCIISGILSIISQVGDFIASSIKRFADAKDFSDLLPGHGGMLDRIDSLIFIAPFVYMIIYFL